MNKTTISTWTRKYEERRESRAYKKSFYPDLEHSKLFVGLGLNKGLIPDDYWVDNKTTEARLFDDYYDSSPPGRWRNKLVPVYSYVQIYKVATDKYPWILGYVDRHNTTCELGDLYYKFMDTIKDEEFYWEIENILFDIFTNVSFSNRLVELLVKLQNHGKEFVQK